MENLRKLLTEKYNKDIQFNESNILKLNLKNNELNNRFKIFNKNFEEVKLF